MPNLHEMVEEKLNDKGETTNWNISMNCSTGFPSSSCFLFHPAYFIFFHASSSCVSAVISSMGLGGGVVAIVNPIHAPMAITAMKAMKTGIATSQN